MATTTVTPRPANSLSMGKEAIEDGVEMNQTSSNKAKMMELCPSDEGSSSGVKGRMLQGADDDDIEAGKQPKSVPHSQGSITEDEQTEERPVSQPGQQQTDSPYEDQWILFKFLCRSFACLVSLFSRIFGDERGSSNIGHGQTAEIPVSQPTQQQITDSQYEDQRAALKFSYWVTGLSFAGLVTLISVIFRDGRGLTHELLFKACTSLTIATMFSGLVLMVLAFIHPPTYGHFTRILKVLKVLKFIALGLLILAALLASIIPLKRFM